MKYRVLVVTGDDAGRVFDLDAPEALIGRAAECDICVEPQSEVVSQRHGRLIARGDAHLVYEDTSSNGTFLGEERVQSISVVKGLVLQLGRMGPKIRIEFPDRPRPGARPTRVESAADSIVRRSTSGAGASASRPMMVSPHGPTMLAHPSRSGYIAPPPMVPLGASPPPVHAPPVHAPPMHAPPVHAPPAHASLSPAALLAHVPQSWLGHVPQLSQLGASGRSKPPSGPALAIMAILGGGALAFFGLMVLVCNRPLAEMLLGARFLGSIPWTSADSAKATFVGFVGFVIMVLGGLVGAGGLVASVATSARKK
ncbi:MAG: FHA domain-containing protein [Minicystis sp.]